MKHLPLTADMTVGQLLEIMTDHFYSGTPTAVFQSVAVPKDGGDPLLITVAFSVEIFDGQDVLPGASGMTPQ